MNRQYMKTPIGTLLLTEDQGVLTGILRVDDNAEKNSGTFSPLLRLTEQELNEYFAGRRRIFDLPMAPAATPFQQLIREGMLQIPYGKTVSYGRLAQMIGRPNAARAAGGALHRNPLCIICPCHRIIGVNGDYVGFGGGLEMKRFLLDLEKKYTTGDHRCS